MLGFILSAIAFAVFLYFYGIKPMTYWKNRGVRQTRKIWIAGDNFRTLFRLESFSEMVIRVYNEIPGVRYCGFYQFTVPTLMIKDPDLIKQLGVKDFEHFLDHRTFIPENADPLWGKNLFALKGQRWREMRPILSPTFTGSKMKAMFTLMSDCGKNFTKYFLKNNQDVVEVELKDIFTRFTNDVIATTAFGIKTDSLEQKENEFYLMGKDATDFNSLRKSLKFFGYILMPKIFALMKVKLFDKHVATFFTDLISNTVKTRKEKGIVRQDMIHLLMEAQKRSNHREEHESVDNGFATVEESDLGKSSAKVGTEMTITDITAQALIFFFAGFDAVSTMMCFLAYELAVNQDIQKRLREEVLETLEEYNGELTYEAVLKMKYMDMVVSEALRKWPNAVAVDRICTQPYTIQPVDSTEKPVHLEKGTVIWFPIIAIHRDPEFYPNPDKFDPERFNDDNKNKINPYTYIPFGVGPRNCIGNRFALMEIKVIVCYILSNFEIIPSAKSQIPLKISRKGFNLQAENGFWFNLKRLEKI